MPDAHRAFDEMIDNNGFRRLQGQFARILQLSFHHPATISQYPFAGAFAGGAKSNIQRQLPIPALRGDLILLTRPPVVGVTLGRGLKSGQ